MQGQGQRESGVLKHAGLLKYGAAVLPDLTAVLSEILFNHYSTDFTIVRPLNLCWMRLLVTLTLRGDLRRQRSVHSAAKESGRLRHCNTRIWPRNYRLVFPRMPVDL